MTVQDIIDYIDRSPYSINRVILKQMLNALDNVDGAGAGAVDVQPEFEVDELVVKKNGVFKAPEGKVYNKIIVNVKGDK